MADVLAVRDSCRAQSWALVVQECESSGLTKREFCRQHGINEKSYYYWLRKLRAQMVEAAVPKLVELEGEPGTTELLHIKYRGAELSLPAGVNIGAVTALLQSIQNL